MLFDKYLPGGLGIELFGREHLCWLAASSVICVGLCLLYRRLGGSGARALELFVSCLILSLEAMRIIVQIAYGVFGLNYLPLHLCGIASYLTFAHSILARKNKLIGEILYSLCLPGAVFALIFPDWLRYPALNLLSIQSFIIHILIAAYPAMLVFARRIRPDAKRLPKCLALLMLYSIPIYFINKALGLNFLFLNIPSPGSPLEFFDRIFGNPGYIIGFIPLLAAVWALLYLPIELRRRTKHKNTFGSVNGL